MKRISIITFLVFIVSMSFAQSNYRHALGVKFPGGFSVTYKTFVTTTNNIEAQATVWNKGFRTSGLYEFNFYSFPTAQNLSWFVGPGVHIGFWKAQYQKTYNSSVDLGIDGIIGLDYKFNKTPINVSIDWQPSVTLLGSTGFTPAYGGFAVRYTF